MEKYTLSNLNNANLKSLIRLRTSDEEWPQPSNADLSDDENFGISIIKQRLQRETVNRLNEATVWGKAVYPLLLMIESKAIKSWADVPLSAVFSLFSLEGIADGLISKDVLGVPQTPYLVVVEAKKAIDAKDPLFQLYGAMLAAAKLNWDDNQIEPQIIYGCYTIADSWTFLRGVVSEIEADKPILTVQPSREYIERNEAEIILGILKAIVNEQQN